VRRSLLILAASASLVTQPVRAARTELTMPVETQQTPVWCWAATASMALQLLGFPDLNPGRNYQCGVVAAAFPDCDDDCTKCVTTIDAMTNMVGVLDRYRDLSIQRSSRPFFEAFNPNYVPYPHWARIKHSLDLSYPVIAGISPDGKPSNPARSEHAVLITGYDDNYRGSGEQWVIVKDPYPYASGASPYSNAGYPYQPASGTAQLPWRILRDRMNLTSAVFLEKLSA
jgi:hypothetical protein